MNPLVLLRPEARAPIGDDEALVERIREGDDLAFEELYRRYHRRVAAYVRRMVGDHGRAEDVTQEVFLSALRRMRQTASPIAFRPWVYEIARNACIDHFRRSSRVDEVPLPPEDGRSPDDHLVLASSAGGPDVAVARKQELDLLRGAFGDLSPNHHEILVLRELDGLSYREIGDRMGLTRPAVESTLFRARRRLLHEYVELDSGRRCLRMQAIMADAHQGDLVLGGRERRRLSRHVAWCGPCRQQAHRAGLGAALGLLRMRDRVAAWVPWPLLLALRGPHSRAGTTSGAGPLPVSVVHAAPGAAEMLGPLAQPAARVAVASALALGSVAAGIGVQPHGRGAGARPHRGLGRPPGAVAVIGRQDAVASASARADPILSSPSISPEVTHATPALRRDPTRAARREAVRGAVRAAAGRRAGQHTTSSGASPGRRTAAGSTGAVGSPAGVGRPSSSSSGASSAAGTSAGGASTGGQAAAPSNRSSQQLSLPVPNVLPVSSSPASSGAGADPVGALLSKASALLGR